MRIATLISLIRRFCVACTFIVLIVTSATRPSYGAETLAKHIDTANNVRIFTAGKAFSVTFSAPLGDNGGVLFWRDHQGNPTTSPTKLNGRKSITLTSPDTQTGYYGLVYQSPRYVHEYGFVIQPARSGSAEAEFSDQFGMVHADYQDPHLSSWVKTLTWKTVPASSWSQEISWRRAQGKLELPLILGREWSTDSSKPISKKQLLALESRLMDYLSADLTVTHWELGLEENLEEYYNGSYYWSNLHQKVLIARKVANRVNPDIKFIYQIGGKSREAVRNFAQSDAARVFNILAIHPYGWPKFLNPDNWYTDYLAEVDSILAQHDLEHLPLWITEIGIPQLLTYDKFPRPAYAAYTNFIRLMQSKQVVESVASLTGVKIYTFKNNREFVSVIWSDKNRTLPITEFAIGDVKSRDNFSVVDIVGTPVALNGGSLSIGVEPIFLIQSTQQ